MSFFFVFQRHLPVVVMTLKNGVWRHQNNFVVGKTPVWFKALAIDCEWLNSRFSSPRRKFGRFFIVEKNLWSTKYCWKKIVNLAASHPSKSRSIGIHQRLQKFFKQIITGYKTQKPQHFPFYDEWIFLRGFSSLYFLAWKLAKIQNKKVVRWRLCKLLFSFVLFTIGL